MGSPMAIGANSNDAFWMPFTPMRAFRSDPFLVESADGLYYTTTEGRRVLDGMGGLWCVNLGHGNRRVVEAIQNSAQTLDFVSSFKMSHPAASTYAARLCAIAPEGIDHVFFTNSGSEAVDTALKIARAYHHARGDAGRTKLIGRAKGYHGMGWGGLSVSGIGRHKRGFGPLLPETAQLPLPYKPETMSFGRVDEVDDLSAADALEALLQVNDPLSVAAVIVEPVTGSGGVYPPPPGYLKRLREICDRNGILLIFDEVITGFGRLGTYFAAEAYDVTPDLISCAKGISNGSVPIGAVLVAGHVQDAFMRGPADTIELFHGYTYSAHPLAIAAAAATLDAFEEDDVLAHVGDVIPVWRRNAMTLEGQRHVVDVRVAGILAAVELAPMAGAPGARGQACAAGCLEAGLLVRASGDTIVLSPPLTIEEAEIAGLFRTIRDVVAQLD